MNLIIDKGNTYTKVYLFDQNKIVARAQFEVLDVFLLDKIFKEYSIENAIFSNVGDVNEEVISYLKKKSKLLIFDHQTPLPIINLYSTPETLGLDRIAAACGAHSIFENENVLCIDMGTCITYDFFQATKGYTGGGISPGLSMRFKALNTFTARLPLIKPENYKVSLVGDSTENSILSGVINGMINEIKGTIDDYMSKYKDVKVLMCGGDLSIFDTQLKNSIFARPDLVPEGLNTILKYNVE